MTKDSFNEYIWEQFSFLGSITIRKMFGGAGIYLDSVMFGLVDQDTVYLKADKSTIPEFEALGMGPFIYKAKGKPVRISYYQLPEDILEDQDQLTLWAEKAVKVSRK
ncbi:MAG: TfoX/Sxy family protein [Candidatus Margulisbacteria bacterium]|nr:TfoX/Sxy family protein [Candidatus Margulisiibacteriota bacterium]